MNTVRAQPKAEHLDFPSHFHPRAAHSSAAKDQDLRPFTAENGASWLQRAKTPVKSTGGSPIAALPGYIMSGAEVGFTGGLLREWSNPGVRQWQSFATLTDRSAPATMLKLNASSGECR